jgi:serine/threonine-protein phosphatase 2A catalytic subunit
MSNDEPDQWIAQLMQCKPLTEADVKKLCEKVSVGKGVM